MRYINIYCGHFPCSRLSSFHSSLSSWDHHFYYRNMPLGACLIMLFGFIWSPGSCNKALNFHLSKLKKTYLIDSDTHLVIGITVHTQFHSSTVAAPALEGRESTWSLVSEDWKEIGAGVDQTLMGILSALHTVFHRAVGTGPWAHHFLPCHCSLWTTSLFCQPSVPERNRSKWGPHDHIAGKLPGRQHFSG